MCCHLLQVVRDMLSSRDDWTCCLGRDSQDPRGAEQMEGGDGGDVRWLWAANAALCMKGLAEGVQQCTDVLVKLFSEDTSSVARIQLTRAGDENHRGTRYRAFEDGGCRVQGNRGWRVQGRGFGVRHLRTGAPLGSYKVRA